MSTTKPEFHLQRVTTDGAAGPVEVFPVTALPTDTQMGRRGFLGAGLTAASVVALADRAAAGQGDPVAKAVFAHTARVVGVAFGPDGALFTASADRTVKRWKWPGGELERTDRGLEREARALDATADGKLLAVGDAAGEIRLLNDRLVPVRHTAAHGVAASAVTFTPDGRGLASGGADKSVRRWSVGAGEAGYDLRPGGPPLAHNHAVRALAFAAGGRLLAVGGYDPLSDSKTRASEAKITLWSVPSGTKASDLTGHEAGITALAVSPDGRTLASGSNDQTVRIWAVAGGPPGPVLRFHKQAVNAVRFSPDGRRLATAADDRTLRLWSFPEAQPVWTYAAPKAAFRCLAFSPDGRWLAAGDADGAVALFDLSDLTFRGYLYDVAANSGSGVTVKVKDERTGGWVSYTLPCGSPVPPGSVCVCNCVAGKLPPPPPPSYRPPDDIPLPRETFPRSTPSYGGGSMCSCNKICVCIPVCQALRLLDPDPVVRTMAGELLLLMGRRELGYMTWAAGRAAGPLRYRIRERIAAVENGAAPDPSRWPTPERLAGYLSHPDEVVAIMAAQLCRAAGAVPPGTADRIAGLLVEAGRRPWYVRHGVAVPAH